MSIRGMGPVRRPALAAVMAAAIALASLSWSGAAREAHASAPPTRPTPCAATLWRTADPAFAALPGAKAYFGYYAGGTYRIEIPDNWNKELVLYAHGYAGEGDLLGVSGPSAGWRAHMIEQGFAWAASSYRCNGYVPGVGLQDTLLLETVFQDVNGRIPPVRTYLTGHSMGGHVTLLGMQEYPEAFAAGLAMCPAGPTLFDYFAANGAAAEVVTGIKYSPAEPSSATLQKILAALGTPPNYTPKGLQMASIMVNSTGGPRPFVFDGLTSYFAMTISGSKLAGEKSLLGGAASTTDWTYAIDPSFGLTLDQLNAQVRRLGGDPALRGADTPYNELMPFTGKIARPLLTMHTTGDMYVPIFLERDLKAAVDKAGKSDLLVQRIYRDPRHCGFSDAETNQAFDDMVAWARNKTKPAGDDINADFSNAGMKYTNPLRPGDPGAMKPGARILPPNTGSGEGERSDAVSDEAPLSVGASVLVSGAIVLAAFWVRRRS